MGTKILIIGAGGFTGSYLMHEAANRGLDAIGTSRIGEGGLEPLELTDFGALRQVLQKHSPQTVILAAGQTNMDYCELHQGETRVVNVGVTGEVADWCGQNNAKLVFYSSDAVFDGRDGPYDEESHAPNPTSVYAKQKVESEKIISSRLDDFLIIRTSSVFGWDSRNANFIARLVTASRGGREFKAPFDQSYTPTYVKDLAGATFGLLQRESNGVYNAAGPDILSRYEFAGLACEVLGLDSKIVVGVKTSDLRQSAPRLVKGGLISGKLEAKTGFHPRAVRAGLQDMKADSPPDAD